MIPTFRTLSSSLRVLVVLCLCGAALGARAQGRPSKVGNRAPNELRTLWIAVERVERDQPLFNEVRVDRLVTWKADPTWETGRNRINLANFLRLNRSSAVSPYEAWTLARGLLHLPTARKWSHNAQIITSDGQYAVGDRLLLNDATRKPEFGSAAAPPKETLATVVAVDGDRIQVLIADEPVPFRTREVARQDIAEIVVPAHLDGRPLK